MLIIADRLSTQSSLVWTEFAAANADLFERPSPLMRWHSEETLTSDRARRSFVMPDLCG